MEIRILIVLVLVTILINALVDSPSVTHSATVTNKNIKPKKKVFVCITGQLSSLELANKIDKLLNPLGSLGYEMFISLVLSTNSALYVNNNNGDKMRLFKSITEVKNVLANVSGVIATKHYKGVNDLGAVPLNPFYKKSLGKKQGVTSQRRAKLNARQFRMLQFCSYWRQAINQSSFFVRIREDTLIRHINLPPLIKHIEGGAVVTPKCETFRGINDKMAFGPTVRAHDFFKLPFKYYLRHDKVIKLFNPEQLYKRSYAENGFKLQASDEFLVTKGVTKIMIRDRNSSIAVDGKLVCTVVANPFQNRSLGC